MRVLEFVNVFGKGVGLVVTGSGIGTDLVRMGESKSRPNKD